VGDDRRQEANDEESRLRALQDELLELVACAEFIKVRRQFTISAIAISICALVAVCGVVAAGVAAGVADGPTNPSPKSPGAGAGTSTPAQPDPSMAKVPHRRDGVSE